jgi:hypothetical protein
MMGRVLERRSYAIRDDATEQEVASACKAALVVLWEDLEWFEIDLSGLDQEPECAEAVAALQDRRRRRWLIAKLESSAHLEPGRDDDKLCVVLPLLSRTIGSTGLSRDHARIIFSVDDEATSCLFDLTPKQLGSVRDRLLADGVSSDILLPWQRT